MDRSRPILLLTRPDVASRAVMSALPQAVRNAVEPIISPLLQIDVTGPLPDIDPDTGLIFTSVNGVNAFAALGGDVTGRCVIAVGLATGAALSTLGATPQIAGGTADQLVTELVTQRATSGQRGPLLHLRGAHAVGDVAQRLSRAGVPTHEAIVYHQTLKPFSDRAKAALLGDTRVIAPLFSPRTARQFVAESRGACHVDVVAISAAVAKVVGSAPGMTCVVAQAPTQPAMLRKVCEMVAHVSVLERPRRET